MYPCPRDYASKTIYGTPEYTVVDSPTARSSYSLQYAVRSTLWAPMQRADGVGLLEQQQETVSGKPCLFEQVTNTTRDIQDLSLEVKLRPTSVYSVKLSPTNRGNCCTSVTMVDGDSPPWLSCLVYGGYTKGRRLAPAWYSCFSPFTANAVVVNITTNIAKQTITRRGFKQPRHRHPRPPLSPRSEPSPPDR